MLASDSPFSFFQSGAGPQSFRFYELDVFEDYRAPILWNVPGIDMSDVSS